nr:translation initiation factor IF-2-like [Symphalangus syndactylus]
MARPPAISMHRARGASVPSRRRIRRPGSARRAAARWPGPRCPRARPAAPIVPRPAPPGCPQARLQPTDGPTLQVLARDARPGMHVNLEKVAGRAGRALRGRAWASPGRRAFVFVWDKGPLRRADAVTGSCGPLSGAVGSLSAGKPEPEGKERRGAGPGKWGLGPALRQRQSRAVPPCEELRELALLCRPPLGRGKRVSVWNPGLRLLAEGLCSSGHASAAPAAARRGPPARAGLSTCAPQVTIGCKATPEDDNPTSVSSENEPRSLLCRPHRWEQKWTLMISPR